jgi:hypothetical protein
MGKYLTIQDITSEMICTIRGVQRETVDGWPRLVLYFEEEEKGLPLTREMAEDLVRILGPHPTITAFFSEQSRTVH